MNINELTFQHEGPWFLIVLFIVLVVAAGFYYYRKTEPAVSPFRRILLGICRGSALIILLMLILEPVLGIGWESLVPPRAVILIDESASMRITDRRGTRSDLVDSLLNGADFRAFAAKFDNDVYAFGTDVRELMPEDTLLWNRQGSDIASAIRAVTEREENRYDIVCLISDGAYNVGEEPSAMARDIRVPIYTIAIGDSAGQNDISIHSVDAPEEAYSGQPVSIEVSVRVQGNVGGRATARLRQEDRIVETRTVELPGQGRETSIKFEFTPAQAGMQEYSVSIAPIPGEITEDNNYRNFFIKVLKSKSKILLVGGRPSPDYAFIFRALSSIPNFEVQSIVEQAPGSTYPESPRLAGSDIDLVALVDFPTERTLGTLRSNIESLLGERPIPVFIITGKTIAATAASFYASLIGTERTRLWNGEQQFFVRFAPGGEEHPAFQNDPSLQIIKSVWVNLPPLSSDGNFLSGWPSERPLLIIDGGRSGFGDNFDARTVAGSGRFGNRKFFVVNGFGAWRWDFYPQRSDSNQEFYAKLIENVILWLSGGEDQQYVIVRPEKEIYESGDKITFRANVSDERFQPVDNAGIRVILWDSSHTRETRHPERELTLQPRGRGAYEGSLDMLDPGSYAYRGIVSINGVDAGEDSGNLFVSDFSMEMMNPQRNSEVLMKLAGATGGKYYRDIHDASLSLDVPNTLKRTFGDRRWEFISSAWLMGILVLVLSVEWFLRKKWGLL